MFDHTVSNLPSVFSFQLRHGDSIKVWCQIFEQNMIEILLLKAPFPVAIFPQLFKILGLGLGYG